MNEEINSRSLEEYFNYLFDQIVLFGFDQLKCNDNIGLLCLGFSNPNNDYFYVGINKLKGLRPKQTFFLLKKYGIHFDQILKFKFLPPDLILECYKVILHLVIFQAGNHIKNNED